MPPIVTLALAAIWVPVALILARSQPASEPAPAQVCPAIARDAMAMDAQGVPTDTPLPPAA